MFTWLRQRRRVRSTRPVDQPPTQREIDAAKWFKATFAPQIDITCRGTLLTTNLLTAIAMQETYYIWVKLYAHMPVDDVLLHCAGDSIGEPDRRYFPKTVDDLLGWPDGPRMFAIGRECLARTGKYIDSYAAKFRNDPKIFCHGYGIFQYDIQFFKTNPRFFLDKEWVHFDTCLRLVTTELLGAIAQIGIAQRARLTHAENVYLAIAYNQGSVDLFGSFQQGHKNKAENTYYGEYIDRYLRLIESLP